jgi:DNA segregation ATPase FtsK/SpoIIIE, S-DNA-T family
MPSHDLLFGLGDTSEPEPAPVTETLTDPETPRKSARKAAPVADPTAAVEAAADAARRQERMLQSRAAELVELHARVAQAGPVQGPQTDTAAPTVTPIEHVIARWHQYLKNPSQVTRLGLPPGSRGRVVQVGLGVEVRLKVPLGTVLPNAAGAVIQTAQAWEWGEYGWKPNDAASFILTRAIVGEDPASHWRAAGRTAHAVYAADPPTVRRQLFEAAGLTVKQADGKLKIPTVIECVLGGRGPEILIDLPAGLAPPAAIKTEAVMARLFRCPDLQMHAEGVRVRIALCTKPATTFPPIVMMEPTEFWRPVTQAERYLAAPNLVLPVGVTASGERLAVPLAKRPHTVLAGTSGSGKSRTLLTWISGLCLGGAAVAIGDFKGDPDLAHLARSGMPGVVHYSTTLAGISRLVMWLRDELALRSALLPILARRGLSRPVWEPVVVIIDEWGQGLDELMNSADPAARGAAAELVNTVSKIFAQGRSFALHLILSTQHVYASAIPGRIAANAATRIIVGKPKAGPAGHIENLFKDDKDAAWDAAEGVTDGQRGRGIVADQSGAIVQFQAPYGYTPAEPPESAKDPELAASWARTRDALTRTPRLRRWGWRFPLDGSGEWQTWSLFPGDRSTGPLPTVAQLDVVALDGPDGQPDPAAAVYDPFSDTYSPGAPPLNLGHLNPTNFD